MIIPLHRLPEDGLAFEEEYDKGELDLSEHDLELTEPLRVSGMVSQVGKIVRVQGRLHAQAIRPCDRCLADVEIAVDENFEVFFEPNESHEGLSGSGGKPVHAGSVGTEAEIRGKDLEFSVYENDEIDLDQLLVEQLALNVPTRVLCKEDCRGLCDQCGTDLNQFSCRCEQPVDPRWQVLLEMKNRTSGKG